MKYFRKNITRLTEVSILIVFIAMFFISEVGIPLVEKDYSATNDYCLIIKDADLSVNKTIDYSVKVNADITIYFQKYDGIIPNNLFPHLKEEHNLSQSKSTKVFLLDKTFLI